MARDKSTNLDPLKSAQEAFASIGLGYDIALDLRLKYCKQGDPDPCLIKFQNDGQREVILPGGIKISDVPNSIKCDKGERLRFRSDVLSFQEMSEQFNQEISLSGKIPSGLFNAMFEFSGCWQKDAADAKTLAFDGWFITLYTVALSKSQIVLRDHVKQAVPSSWDPAALANFIGRFGTHVVVAIKMGGKDVIYVRQPFTSNVQPHELQKRLKELADRHFSDLSGKHRVNPDEFSGRDRVTVKEHKLRFVDFSTSKFYSSKEDLSFFHKRRGGNNNGNLSHSEWLDTVILGPGVISMSFVPIVSLLDGIPGSGFLSHAINLYLRYKPPIEELQQFLEFQLPRQWAPVYGELLLGPQRKHHSASLQFSFMGPKLHVNISPVDVGLRLVTGLRLYLEGKRSDRLAIHLQHLASIPQSFQLQRDPASNFSPVLYDRKFCEPVQWKSFSHVCTAPVESDDENSVVTGAQLCVASYGFRKVLLLRLSFCTVVGASQVKSPEWDGPRSLVQKSGFMSILMSGHFTAPQKPPPKPTDVIVNSAVYPGGPPVPAQSPKMLKFVDTVEMTRGPQDLPGYWVVSGARLLLERGKISLRVKYSLLTVAPPDDGLE